MPQQAYSDVPQGFQVRPAAGFSDLPAGFQPVSGANDPGGDYDFGSFGSIKGARLNGRPATREEAFSLLAKQRGIGQAMGETLQHNQAVVHSLGEAFDTDKAQQEFMKDLTGMLVGGEASKLGSIWKSEGIPIAQKLALTRELSPDAAEKITKKLIDLGLRRIPGVGLYKDAKDFLNLLTQEKSAADPIQAAMQRTAGTLGELAKPNVDQLLGNVRAGLNAKFPGTAGAWEANKVLAPKPEPNYEDLLKQSIAKAQAGKGIGPGTAHVTDPGLHESEILGAHANRLNALPEEFTGEIMKFHNDKEAGLYEGTDPITKGEHETAANLLAQYHIDPTFKNLADASRMYVHNYRVIGDIDKISLGEQPIHQAGPVGYHIKGARIEGYPIDETTLFDGTKDPRKFLTEDEGKHMVETLYGAIRNAQPVNRTLFRGIEPHSAVPSHYKIGDGLSLPLSSFSSAPRTAYDFGDIILQLEGPSQHLNVRPFNSFYENEHLTQGRFEVIGDEKQTVKGPYATSIDSRTGLPLTRRVITIKQVGVH